MSEQLQELINKATAILREFGAREIYIFGSAARSDFDSDSSDIDLAVRGIPPESFYGAVGETMCALDRNIDLIDLDAQSTFGKFLQDHGELTRVF